MKWHLLNLQSDRWNKDMTTKQSKKMDPEKVLKRKAIFVHIGLFFVLLVLFSYVAYSVLGVFRLFLWQCSRATILWQALIAGAVFSMFFIILEGSAFNREHETKLSIWLKNNIIHIVIVCLFLSIACSSLKEEVVFTETKLTSFISIQWMVLTVSIAIFLVYWNIVKKNLPQGYKDIKHLDKSINDILQVYSKQSVYSSVQIVYMPLIMLAVNLIALIVVTDVFFSSKEISVPLQSICIFSFSLCGSTLSSIFFQVFAPIRNEIRTLLKGNKTTAEEINDAQDGVIAEILVKWVDNGFETEKERQDAKELLIKRLNLPEVTIDNFQKGKAKSNEGNSEK